MVLVTLAGTLPTHVVCITTFLILDSSSMDNNGSTLTTTVNLVAKRPINLMFDLFHEVCYGRVLVHTSDL